VHTGIDYTKNREDAGRRCIAGAEKPDLFVPMGTKRSGLQFYYVFALPQAAASVICA
jgi:hypothetical protein